MTASDVGCGGMSLRAYFAIRLMCCYEPQMDGGERRAKWAVEEADALIAELEKPKE